MLEHKKNNPSKFRSDNLRTKKYMKSHFSGLTSKVNPKLTAYFRKLSPNEKKSILNG